MWHEIVNDSIDGKPVLITFCPLCNAVITFDRRINDQAYEFGTSGLLRNSDLVMYDRTTESLWQQFTGEAIVGGHNSIRSWRVNNTLSIWREALLRTIKPKARGTS
jgi:hypothetical protein